MSVKPTELDNVINRVNNFVALRRENQKVAKARQDTKIVLSVDVARMDTGELFNKLKKCTIEEYNRSGRILRLNPYHVYKTFFTDRYRGLINTDSDRLPEQQFTTAFIAAVKFAIGDAFRLASPELKQAWLEVIGEDEEFGTKQVTLQRRVLPIDYSMKSYLLSRYGAASEHTSEFDEEVEATETEAT